MRKLKITGLFTPPHTNDRKKFFNTSFENFKDNVSRDSRYSPYSAIVIDPFTNRSTDKKPADGGYPGLSSFMDYTMHSQQIQEVQELRLKK